MSARSLNQKSSSADPSGEQAHLFALVSGENDLPVHELHERAPLADFDVA